MTRILSSLVLALVLALTSQSMAVARGASAATGNGPMAVYFDAQGQPTSAPHVCPDAALHVLVDLDTTEAQSLWTFLTAVTPQGMAPAVPLTLPRTGAEPRAPPLDV